MGGKKATTTSQVTIPPEVLARYNAVNQRAETAAAKPFQAFGNTAADYVAQLNPQQFAGFNDINATAGSYQPYMTQATQATQAGMGPAYEGIDRYMSPYVKNVADTTGAYMRQQQEQAQSGALGTAASSGAFGGDRAGIAAANLQQQNQMGYGKTMADIMNQGYTQALGASQADLARQLQGGAQMAGLGAQSQQLGLQGAQAKIAAGTMQQQTEQAGKDAMINRFMQEQGLPYQQAQFLANIAMGTGAASGSTTTTQTPRNWMGFADGGHVEGYADGGGVAGPRTYTQSGIGSEGYVPAGDLPVGQLMVAQPPDQQQQSNGTDEIIKIISMMGGGAKNGGAIDQRHGYALDGGVEDPGNRIRLDDALIEQFGGVKPVVSDGRDGELPNSRSVPWFNPSYPGARSTHPLTTEELRNRVNDPDYYDVRGFENARNLANARNQAETNPTNMGIGAGYNLGGNRAKVHPYPPSPTTGVAAPSPIAALQVTPEDNAARRAMMAKALGAREPRASERYMLPTGLVRPPVNALEELNLGAGDPFGAFTESARPPASGDARPPVVDGKPPTISSRLPAYPESPDSNASAIRLAGLADADVTSPILPSTPPRLAGLAGADLASPISQSPPPYPDGMSGADIAERAMATLGSPTQNSSLIDQKPAPLGANPSSGDMADTGLVPTGGYKPIIPLETQLQFVTSELQQPEYKAYLENTYATPAQAAVAFEQIYERANGAGNDVASAYATDVYKAALDGKLNELPPNVAEAYNHFIQNNMDPIQAAGATGRLMVESYSHLDPNARNTLGGGYGTYGIAQHRGSRLEELAKFAGVPLQALIDAPVSTPEGRYYSHGADFKGGLGGSGDNVGDGLARADMTQQRDGIFTNDKPYDQRNFLGKFFRNKDGSMNQNALLSVLMGIGKGAEAQTISPLGGILSGIGSGAQAYKGLVKQQADVASTNIQSMDNLYKMYNNFTFTNPEYAGMTLKQFADSNGLGYMLPTGMRDQSENISAITGGIKPITLRETQGYVDTLVNGEKVSVPFMSDYASLSRLASQWKNAPEGTPQRAAALKAEETIKTIDANGYTTGINEQGQPVVVPVDAARAKMGAVLTDQQNVQNTQDFRTNAVKSLPTIAPQVDAIDRQANIYSKTEAGALASVKGQIGALASALGVNIEGFNDAQQAALVQEALKEKARGIVNRGGGSQDTTDFAKGFIDAGSAGPNLEPDAVKKLLVIEKASLLRERDRLSLHSEWQKQASNPYDMNEYEDWFAKNYPLEEYTTGVSSSMPKFAGETGSVQKPHPVGSNASDIKVGDYFTLPDGKIGQREE
jgi:hypothetical protein